MEFTDLDLLFQFIVFSVVMVGVIIIILIDGFGEFVDYMWKAPVAALLIAEAMYFIIKISFLI